MLKLLIVMKKIVLIPALAFLTMFAFISCDESDDTQIYSGDEIAYFDLTTSTLLVTADNPSMDIEIVSTVATAAARTFNVSVDPSSTAMDGVDYTLSSSSITIPANEYIGVLTVNGIFDGALETGSKLILNLSGDNIAGFDTKFTLDIFKLCESDLAGMYEVTTTYGYHDFLPNYNPSTIMMEVVAVDETTYSVYDFSGGLYTEGPYASAYGTGCCDWPLVFSDICGNISWTGQADPWGDIIPLDGGVNAVDFNTGTITISWYCTGYGEEGVSVYVPQ